jgi:cell division protein FtsI/penicillin-binding protein 2
MKLRNVCLAVLLIAGCSAVFGYQTKSTAASAPKTTKKKAAVRSTARPVAKAVAPAGTAKPAATTAKTPAVRTAVAGKIPVKKRGWVQTWDEPTFAESASGDDPSGEDLTVRSAAIEALGPYNGSIVVVDPMTGRILSMVNQKLALEGGFQPCSTIKVGVALAALREKVIGHTTPIHVFGRSHMDLTNALGYSINLYFANLGVKLGYERMNYYAHLFGYGETAGLNIPGEQPGYFPPAPPKNGGMGMLTSFGEEIKQTPLELAAIMTALANGGTLYYMQYPRTAEEIRDLTPQVKRHLDIQDYISDLKPGMQGAVDFGTARRAKQDTEIYGKTGTCSEGRTHLGWFGSFTDTGKRRLVVVVMLTGGRPSIGPMAAGVAGDVYRRLADEGYFKTAETPLIPASIVYQSSK